MATKAYKGMDKNMQCRGFQYEVGKEYETNTVEPCKSGFHACEYPLDVFIYYLPEESRYFRVEQSGEVQKMDDKTASTKIKIVEEISIQDMINDAVEISKATGRHGTTFSTGRHGTTFSTGRHGTASATGYCGAASATGYYGAAFATGRHGTASATGEHGAAFATGYCGAASATGEHGAASSSGVSSVAIASGLNGKVKGTIGNALFLVERGEWDGTSHPIVAVGSKIVDGIEIKENVWYTLRHGEFVEVDG